MVSWTMQWLKREMPPTTVSFKPPIPVGGIIWKKFSWWNLAGERDITGG